MTAPTKRPMRQIMDAAAEYMRAKGDTFTHYFGAEHLPEQMDAGARYVWLPTADDPTGPTQMADFAEMVGMSRSIIAFNEGVAVHCWGVVAPPDDGQDPDVYRDSAYFMRNNLIIALRAILMASLQMQRSGWHKPTNTSLGLYGRVYVLNFTAIVPVQDTIMPTVRIRQIVGSTTNADGSQTDATFTIPPP